MADAAQQVHEKLLARLASGQLPDRAGLPEPGAIGLPGDLAADIFLTQLTSRQMDRLSRDLQARGQGFYTIGSSGHEGNAAVAAALRVTDPAFLHYRSGAFQLQRARQRSGETPTWDMLLSFAASSADPISGGRHKVLGSASLTIPPQTSTIASHLPKAVGAAYAIGAARHLDLATRRWPDDAVVLASFGDASANHSTAQGAFNAAGWTAYQGAPLPLIFLCEDNGIGISTRTPAGWIAAQFRQRVGLAYIAASGLDIASCWAGTQAALALARDRRKPVFLHLDTVRLYGHAGSDVQAVYLPKDVIARDEERDTLAYGAALMIAGGLMTARQIAEAYQDIGATLARQARDAVAQPKLTSRAAVRASVVPPRRAVRPPAPVDAARRTALFAAEAGQMDKPQHLARILSWTLADLMLAHPEIVVMGEDVGPKGGVYNATARLHERFGPARVINTLLDEQTILGLAIGMAHDGFVPMPEIQFLAYVHNAEDQIRGEAATLSFFSSGQYTNPMVIRIAGLGYQKGFGGHFHNDNSLAVFRDIPGLVLAVPSCGADAAPMLRECVRLARDEGRVVVFVEPIALYMTRDLNQPGDGLWTSAYRAPADAPSIALGAMGVHGDGTNNAPDLAIVTYGNGHYLSRQAQHLLAADGVGVRVIDLRWLAPLDGEALLAAIGDVARVLIVDECRITGSQSEALMALLTERAPDKRLARLAADDSFIPLGTAATLPLPSRDDIVAAAREMCA